MSATQASPGRTSALRAFYDTLIAEPIREGHLRLPTESRFLREITRFGLTALALLMTSALLSERWRSELVAVGAPPEVSFVPVAILPVTLIGLFIGWSVASVGAAYASRLVRLAFVVAFAVVNAPISRPLVVAVEDVPGLTVAPSLAQASFVAVLGSLLVQIALPHPPGRRSAWVRRILSLVTVVGLGIFFGCQLWAHVAWEEAGVGTGVSTAPVLSLLQGTMLDIQGLLVPVVFVSGFAIAAFAMAVSTATARSLETRSFGVVRIVLVVVIAIRLVLFALSNWDDVSFLLQERLDVVLRTVVSIASLFVLGWFARRAGGGETVIERVQERTVYSGALLLSVPVLVVVFVISLRQYGRIQATWDDLSDWLTGYPEASVDSFVPIGLWAGLAIIGVVLLRRGRPAAGWACLMVGLWGIPDLAGRAFGNVPPLSLDLADGLVLVGVSVAAAIGWRRMSEGTALALVCLLVLSGLIATEGDFLTLAAEVLTFSAGAIVVFGIVYSLLTEAPFTGRDGERFPRASRSALFVGYLVLSATILNWALVSHQTDLTGPIAGRGLFLLGIPLVAWLFAASRDPVPRGTK